MSDDLVDAEEADVWNRADSSIPEHVEDEWNQIQPSRSKSKRPRPRHASTIDMTDNLMRVSATSAPQSIAGSIRIAIFEEQRMPVIRAVGAGAVNQACKGIAIARGYIATSGRDLATTIGFETVMGDQGTNISAQTFHLFLR